MISNGKSIREWMIISQIRDCKMLKVCINRQTGNGRLGGHHTDFAFTGLAGVKISALADANVEAQKNYFLTGAEKLYSSFEEMMECEKPDIVVLASRLPDEHSYQIKYALERNCHILCEKPLASTVAQAKRADRSCAKKEAARADGAPCPLCSGILEDERDDFIRGNRQSHQLPYAGKRGLPGRR